MNEEMKNVGGSIISGAFTGIGSFLLISLFAEFTHLGSIISQESMIMFALYVAVGVYWTHYLYLTMLDELDKRLNK